MTKTNFPFITILLIIIVGSCSEDASDCTSRMCSMAGGWSLTEVYVDDAKDNSNLSQFSLTLNMPSPPTATTSGFTRAQVSGHSDNGTWSLENNETILRLIPYDDPSLTEDWIIESLTSNKMVLIINRDVSIKQDPGKIEFILESF